ncbi:phytase [Glycomyces sp. TRM65418]|uniref:phytase n=1 Tax=Glycomyces sp. TRM65418 TaxID=2867006 RepID=UPI001CE60AB7|nr:phytase [Glycomyces sp. TRM65418]MCC3765785.1 phytase [Glycomyces sp. TRM65418]QZD55376.1 phytase [Glycomyces sp. TRM65418]
MLKELASVTALGAAAVLAVSTAAQADHHDDEPVTAQLETPALWDEDDADADDPAIWIHPEDPDESLVIATAKEAGIYVYDLDGEEVQHIEPRPAPSEEDKPGRYNNVDIVHGFELDGERVDLAVASDRGMDTLGVFAIEDGELEDVTDPEGTPIFSESQEAINEAHTAYGLTTWTDRTGAYALVSRNAETEVALLKLVAVGEDHVGWELVRTLALPAEFAMPDGSTWAPCDDPGEYAQVEGMVVDRTRGVAYLGQELVGIWKVNADLTGEPQLVDTAIEFGVPGEYDAETDECEYGPNPGYGGSVLRTDIEGLTIYRTGRGKGYLLASSQGDDTFAVYRIEGGNKYLGSFAIGDGEVDSTQHSDGADVVNVDLPGFEGGLLVVQDGDNTPEGDDESSTNFKFVAWEDVVEHTDFGLKTARGRH